MTFQHFFLVVLCLYFLSTLFYLIRLVSGRPLFSVIALRIAVVAAILQALTLGVHFLNHDGKPFRHYLDYYQTSAFVLAAIFIGLCFFRKFYAAGPLFVTLIDILCLLSFTHGHADVVPAPRGTGYLVIHLCLIFISLSVFAVGLISAVLFLIAEHQIKLKRFDGWMAKLPSLAVLERIHDKALTAGFVLFTFAIIMGTGYSKIKTGHYLGSNSKELFSFILWFFFAILLNFRVRQGWRGHKGIVLSMAGFAGMVLLYFVGLKS